jgi:hypothetical protein
MAEDSGDKDARSETLNNIVALTIAILATFLALSAIKGGNIAQAIEQASAERNNSWAWYQAVRVREDMSTYVLAGLNRSLRTTPPQSEEAARLRAEIAEQEAEVSRVRERKDEVQARAEGAETEFAALSLIDDQYDLSTALISIAMSLLAVCVLAKARWLFVFSLLPGLAGMGVGVAAMLRIPIQAQALFAWLS